MGTSEAPAARRGGRRGEERTGRTGPLALATEAGLWILLIATPLALGSVSETASVLMEGGCFALLILGWWAVPRQGPSGVPRSFKVVGAAFVLWTLFQMVPLPPSVLRWVSPGTQRLYAQHLPGYAGESGSADLQAWLLKRQDTPSKDLAPRLESQTGLEGKVLIPLRWKPISWYPEKSLRCLVRFLAYWALFLLMVEFLPERACRRRLPWFLLLLGFGIALEGFVQMLSWNGKIYWFIKVYQGHPFGPWVNRDHFSGYMEMILPLGAAILLRAGGWTGRGRRRRHAKDIVPRVILVLFCLAWIGVALVAARSRGGLFSLLLTAALYFMAQLAAGEWKGRRPLATLLLAGLPLLVVVGGAALYTLRPLPRPAPVESEMEPSLAGRIVVWKGIVSMVAANPFSGTGLGTFALAYPVYKTYGVPYAWQQAHNDYLQVLAESGLVGFALLGAGLILLFRRFLLPVFLRPWRRQDPVALGSALGMVPLLIHSAVDFNLQIPSNGLLFVVLGGLLVRFCAPEPDVSHETGGDAGARSAETLD